MAKKKAKYNKVEARSSKQTEPTPSGATTIVLSQTKRGNIDVGDYMAALKQAENVENPNRSKLLDIYDECLTDAHLFAVIQKRKAAILNSPIEFTRDGLVDEKMEEQLRSPWFQNFVGDILDAEQFGNSLVQFRREGDWMNYDLIPRKHYDPVRKLILKRQTDTDGISFEEFADILLIGKPRDLGLLAKAALYVIYKRNAMSDFAGFIEKYGHPFMEGTYDAWDTDTRQKLLTDIYNAGGSMSLVHPAGTNLTLHDTTSKGATGELYKGFVVLCNDEISKLELGNTLTTEVGEKGTQALGTVHQAGEDQITRVAKQFVLNVLNYEMTDIFTKLGFDTTGGRFTFAVPQNKDLSSRIVIDTQLRAMGLEIPHDYLRETYGIPKPEKGEEVSKKEPEPAKAGDPDPKPTPEPVTDPEEEKRNKSAQEKVDEKKERSLKNSLWDKIKNLVIPSSRPKYPAFQGKINALYRSAGKETESPFSFDENALKLALIRIYEKDFNPLTEIERNLFDETWNIINQATEEGFSHPAPTSPEYDFCQEIKKNNAVFAAFKVHRMQNDIAAQLLDNNGQLKSFQQWRRDVADLVDHHKEHWLRTEYETAVHRAHQAADWSQFMREKDILPNLKWNPSTSITPGLDHTPFWNRIWSIDDPFWEEHKPGDRWGCKCSLSSTDEPVTENNGLGVGIEEPSPGLAGNPGVTGRLFSEDHPYMTETYKGADKAVDNLIKSLSEDV